MIPKIIHYCWFGNAEKPPIISEYIDAWHKKLPDYQFMEWNEKNFDVYSSIDYVKEAYSKKKFAFVSDYVRLVALKEYGGIYLDTDIEILKPFDELISNYSLVTGFETMNTLITAFIAAEKEHPIISEFVARYKSMHFVDESENCDLTPINNRFTDLMIEYGLVLNNKKQLLENDTVLICPYDVFAGYDMENSHPKITDDTLTVHHFQSSWKKMTVKEILKFKIIVPVIQAILGYDRYDKLKANLKRV
ncbi:MAG: glycosyltransferase family 32 protein [Clostridia bacterium]